MKMIIFAIFSSLFALVATQSTGGIPPGSPFSPPAFPSSLDENQFGSLDSAALAFSNDRSLLPGVQVYPATLGQQQQPFQPLNSGFLTQRSVFGTGGPSQDLETWSKSQAMRTNQENAVVAHLAQMAPQRRNQLVRDVANGNASAANELVSRLLRDLAATQHGQMAFPQLGAAVERQQQQLANGLFMDFNGQQGMGISGNTLGGTGIPSNLPLPLQMQLLAQQRQQQLLGVGGNRVLLATNQPNGFVGMMGANQPTMGGAFGMGSQSALASSLINERLRQQQLLMLQQQQMQQQQTRPSSPFGVGNEFADLSRPAGTITNNAGSTQITPFSQALRGRTTTMTGQFGSGIGQDFGRTLSGASGFSSSLNNGGFLRGLDDTDATGLSSSGRGFVDDLEPEEAFGRRSASGVPTMRREQEVKGNRGNWNRIEAEIKKTKKE